jgi:hypothetical protein
MFIHHNNTRRSPMKAVLVTVCLAAMMLFGTDLSRGQEKKPEVPEAVKNLAKFVGKWESNASLMAEGKTYKVLYKVDCRLIADGNGLYVDEWFSNKELGTLKGSDLFGYDPYDTKIHVYSVDNMGTTHEHTGEWLTPDHLYVEHNSVREGKKYVEKLDFTFAKKDELQFKLVGTLDDQVVQTGEGTFHRKSGSAKK